MEPTRISRGAEPLLVFFLLHYAQSLFGAPHRRDEDYGPVYVHASDLDIYTIRSQFQIDHSQFSKR